jgi:RimJ/RimL family protein N-acetyltransferase
MKVTLRPVVKSDLKDIFKWRNHPFVRRGSFSTEKISWDSHLKYWGKRLQSPTGCSLMIVAEGQSAGLLRLDSMGRDGKGDDYEVSILIPPHMWGRGIGTTSLNKAKQFARKKGINRLVAKIKVDNVHSIRAFEAVHFKLESLNYVFKL